jgi:hypothetical protein
MYRHQTTHEIKFSYRMILEGEPILLIRDLELVKNILVMNFQNITDRVISFDEKLDP